MVRAVRIYETGGPEVMQLEEVELEAPGPGMVSVATRAIGLNYIDTYHRSGLYPLPLPIGLGLEGAGVVTAVGEGVDMQVGERVAYCSAGFGASAEAMNLPAERLVKLPDGIGFEQAAAALVKAAQMLAIDPKALQLRYLQTLTEIAGDKSSTIVFPLDLIEKAKKVLE